MKQFMLFMALVASIAIFSCQKEQLQTVVSTELSDGFVVDRDSPYVGHGHHGKKKHKNDSTHVHDSTHVQDSTHVHPPHDSTHIGGHHGNHPQDSTNVHCTASVETLTVADLPLAAQDYLTANHAGAVIVYVKKVTNSHCKVRYEVKIEGVQKRLRFDADGNKIGG